MKHSSDNSREEPQPTRTPAEKESLFLPPWLVVVVVLALGLGAIAIAAVLRILPDATARIWVVVYSSLVFGFARLLVNRRRRS